MLGSHHCYYHSADEETEARSGSMIVQGLNNLAEEVDIELWSRSDTKTHIILLFFRVCWTMKGPILDSLLSLSLSSFDLYLSLSWSSALCGAFFTLTLWLCLIWQPSALSSDQAANPQDSKDRTASRASLPARDSYDFLSLARHWGPCTHLSFCRQADLPVGPGSPAVWPRAVQAHGLGRTPSLSWRTGLSEKDGQGLGACGPGFKPSPCHILRMGSRQVLKPQSQCLCTHNTVTCILQGLLQVLEERGP